MKKLDKRRRREGKTNYAKRLRLLKSEMPRLIVRKTNKYIIIQIIESENAKDKVIITLSTKELLKYGWPLKKSGSLKSLAAAYITGILMAKKSLNKKIKKVILDSGLIPSTKGSRVYAVVKGVSEGGLTIPVNDKILPDDEKINRYDFFEKIKNKIADVK